MGGEWTGLDFLRASTKQASHATFRGMKTSLAILTICGLSFALGLVTGRLTAPVHESEPNGLSAQSMAALLETAPSAPQKDGLSIGEEKGAKQRFLEGLKDDPRVALAQKLAGWSSDPAAVVGSVIDGMNEDEITVILSSLTSLKKEKLEEVEDLPGYAKRLAELALNDLSEEVDYNDPDLREVYFSLEPNPESAVEEQRGRFGAEKSRMHAILPMNDYDRDSVFVKWTRESDQQVMLFDRYPIRQSEEYNWVYLEPNDGWQKDGYTVSFISDDEEMTLLGTGDFIVE